MTAAKVRAWASEQGIDCPARGRVPSNVEHAYNSAHQPDLGDPAPTPDPPVFRLVVELPGAENVQDEAAAQLLEAVWTIFHAGRAAERRALLEQLEGLE